MRTRERSPDVHARSVKTSSALSGLYVADLIGPLDVVRVLNEAGVSFLLAGAHGLGGWIGAPRATQDVDVVVAKRHLKKAVAALLEAFPRLEADDVAVVTRLRDRESGSVAIDVMKPVQPIFQAALKNTYPVRAGGLRYRIPSLEMALAMKFAPMVSLYREAAKKYLDAHDFIQMVQTNPDIDLDKLSELGDLVYPGGGAEIREMVRRARAGEKLNL